MKKATRQAYGETLIKFKEHPDLVVLDADLSAATKTDVFAKWHRIVFQYGHRRSGYDRHGGGFSFG